MTPFNTPENFSYPDSDVEMPPPVTMESGCPVDEMELDDLCPYCGEANECASNCIRPREPRWCEEGCTCLSCQEAFVE